ncbi:hypothetical protein DQ04_02751030 [Trypanosoma grayi]|uniref:hypothetical protein n=1 Tax=Trypanosoma grayi TaxID=71804 RepID=UPI0004F4BD53|nr:hypothetical protein DQ04_02751030 [Trypanosoma grayi]KEG11305.1 hypothetical protein DQ04_02751030 [Trypanosoma grayi]
MFRPSHLLRFHQLTRVLLSSTSDTAAEPASIESLEAGIRSFTQPGGIHDSEKLKTLLDDLIHCSDPRKVRFCKEACRLAHAAGCHARCAELFFSCRNLAPVSLSDVVVNAAASTSQPEYLQQCLTSIGGADKCHGPSSHSAFLVLRIYWQSTRCYVQLEHARQGSHMRKYERAAHGVEEEEVVVVETMEHLEKYRIVSAEAFRLLQLPADVSFDTWWSKSKRLVLYHADDYGEAAVYEQHFSCWERQIDGKTIEWLAPQVLVSMLRSCVKSERWDLACRYAELSEVYLLSEKNPPDDALFQQTLLFFNVSMQNPKGVAWVRRIRSLWPDYIPSVSLAHITARLAADTSDEELAVWCLQALLSERQPVPPSPQDVFPCLTALARCRAKNFKKLLYALEESGLVKLTEEEYLYLNLTHCRRSVHWEDELNQYIERHLTHVTMGPTRAGLSVRNAGLMLRILQEGEHAGFMKYYRIVRKEFYIHNLTASVQAQWLAIALKWAATQRRLELGDYELLVKEAYGFLGNTVDDSSPALFAHSLRSKLESRLNVVQQLWEPKKDRDNTAAPLNGDLSIMRFVRQRQCLSQHDPPSLVEGAPACRSIGLWGTREALVSLVQRDWRAMVQKGY